MDSEALKIKIIIIKAISLEMQLPHKHTIHSIPTSSKQLIIVAVGEVEVLLLIRVSFLMNIIPPRRDMVEAKI